MVYKERVERTTLLMVYKERVERTTLYTIIFIIKGKETNETNEY